jgi:hypothetical protein
MYRSAVAWALALMVAALSATAGDAPRREDSPKAKFIKKYFRDQTPAACTAPPDARADKQ